MIDEPLIAPFTPGESLVRLAQVSGAISSQNSLASPNAIAALHAARTQLLEAISLGKPDGITAAQTNAQEALAALYRENEANPPHLAALGFPTPEQVQDPNFIDTPDPGSVTLTHTLRGKQVLTSIAFNRAAGATAYWLHIVRYWQEDGETQRIEEPVLESLVPLFSRVRLPVGKHFLRIKSRNLSVSAITDEFEIEVPQL